MCRSISTKNFLTAVRNHLEKHQEASPMLRGVITCKRDNTIKEIILNLDSEKMHRIYVVDEEENLEGVITLRDIISKLVHEPHGYFGDFFDGFVPLPQNSRVWKTSDMKLMESSCSRPPNVVSWLLLLFCIIFFLVSCQSQVLQLCPFMYIVFFCLLLCNLSWSSINM